MDESEAIANFIAFTDADNGSARQMLEATAWQLEDAVQLYFATHGGDAAPAPKTDEEIARELAGQGGGEAVPGEADYVRPADGVRTEALYEDDYGMMAMPSYRGGRGHGSGHGHGHGMLGGHGGFGGRGTAQPVVHDPFRNFGEEGAAGGRGAGAGGEGDGPGGEGLSSLFKAPVDLMFPGVFEAAKAAALEKEQWLIVNLQSVTEFASHQLNRDTWGNELVRSLVKESFVFWQVYDSAEEGSKVASFYKLTSFPTTMVIDPITGQRMCSWDGFVDPEKLMEDLFPFLDKPPTDSSSAALLGQSAAQKRMRLAGGAGASAPPVGGAARPGRELSEDEQLAMALAASMEDGDGDAAGVGGAEAAMEEGGGGRSAGDGPSGASLSSSAAAAAEEEEAKARAKEEANERRMASAVQALGPEPEQGAPGSCRVALRLPDGSRDQRRFLTSAPLSDVHDFCLTKVPEALAGRPFVIKPSHPGAGPFSDMGATLEASGAANAMLVMGWAD